MLQATVSHQFTSILEPVMLILDSEYLIRTVFVHHTLSEESAVLVPLIFPINDVYYLTIVYLTYCLLLEMIIFPHFKTFHALRPLLDFIMCAVLRVTE
jgi:hypothetical protein